MRLLKLAAKSLLLLLMTIPPILAQASEDPYLWLEDVGGQKALDWVRQRNAITRKLLEPEADFAPLRRDILAILDAKERIPYLNKMGDYYYNFWRDGEHPRGIWRRTTLAEYRNANPAWETVLDLDEMARKDQENWVWKGAVCREPYYDRCLLHLSRGGADAVVIKEFDLASKSLVADGYTLPEAKLDVAWQGRDALYVGTNFGAGAMTESGYPRIVKLWQRGTPLASAVTIFEGQHSDVSVNAGVSEHQGYRHELIQRSVTFFTDEYFLREQGQLSKLDVPLMSRISFFGPQLLVNLREDWQPASQLWRAGSLLAIDLAAFQKGSRDFTPLFQPSERTALQSSTVTRNFLILNTLDNVRGRLIEWRYADGAWTRRDIGAPAFGSLGASAVDDQDSDAYFLTHTDYLKPDTLYLAQAGSDEREPLKRRPAFFDSTPFEITQREARSKDGTLVPYFIVAKKGLPTDGNTPTLLYGYGGFQIALTPTYSAGIGRGWLQKGGVYVVANIRGGGEFGPRWHQAALKANRQRAYEDFIAVAEDLIARKVTRPKKLGIMGGSNGGLLMGVMLTQRPDLFGAVVCQVPLLDMRRYNKLLAGASWVGEYGNPDIPAEWAWIKNYSPYQNVHPHTHYPNTLFITSTRDDRVHPGHARKMMAKLQSVGARNVWYYENIEGGHGGAANNAQKADMTALEYSFLSKMLK